MGQDDRLSIENTLRVVVGLHERALQGDPGFLGLERGADAGDTLLELLNARVAPGDHDVALGVWTERFDEDVRQCGTVRVIVGTHIDWGLGAKKRPGIDAIVNDVDPATLKTGDRSTPGRRVDQDLADSLSSGRCHGIRHRLLLQHVICGRTDLLDRKPELLGGRGRPGALDLDRRHIDLIDDSKLDLLLAVCG